MREDGAAERYARKIKKLKKQKQMMELWAIEQAVFVDSHTIRCYTDLINALNFELKNKQNKLEQMEIAA